MTKRRGLGRGLDALLAGSSQPVPTDPATADSAAPATAPTTTSPFATNSSSAPDAGSENPTAGVGQTDSQNTVSAPGDGELATIAVEQIFRSSYQPRRHFDEDALNDLAQSIRSQGLMQPLVLRRRAAGGYEIVAGERRWRAAQLAQLQKVPALIREVDDEQAMAMALIENIRREDLNPLEEAQALHRLKEDYELTQQQLADTVGKSRVAVANSLRLLKLAPAARTLLENGDIEMGHARALLGLEAADQDTLAREVADRGLSVRQTELRVRQLQGRRDKPVKQTPIKDADTRILEQQLSEKIGAPVSIDADSKGRGRLTISYSSLAELDGVLAHLK